jgi:hypothetical protein
MPSLGDRALNVVLASTLGLIVLGGGALGLGVAQPRLALAQQRLAEASARAEGWARERAGFRAPDARASEERWRELLRRVEPVPDAPALIARVAERMQAPSVRQLAVGLREPDPALGPAPEPIVVRSPDGASELTLTRAAVELRFRASYEDALALLTRIEQRGVPARLDALDMKRDATRVIVRAQLGWFTRTPDARR